MYKSILCALAIALTVGCSSSKSDDKPTGDGSSNAVSETKCVDGECRNTDGVCVKLSELQKKEKRSYAGASNGKCLICADTACMKTVDGPATCRPINDNEYNDKDGKCLECAEANTCIRTNADKSQECIAMPNGSTRQENTGHCQPPK